MLTILHSVQEETMPAYVQPTPSISALLPLEWEVLLRYMRHFITIYGLMGNVIQQQFFQANDKKNYLLVNYYFIAQNFYLGFIMV